jgi:hypothetical protein
MQSSTQVHAVEVSVNRQPVRLPERLVIGVEIKQAAIAQGVAIGENFQLSVKRGDHYQVVGDSDEIRVHAHQEFVCVAPDDNS